MISFIITLTLGAIFSLPAACAGCADSTDDSAPAERLKTRDGLFPAVDARLIHPLARKLCCKHRIMDPDDAVK